MTAPILSIEDKFNKFALLEVDDGSGAVVHIKITRLDAEIARSVECPSNTTVSKLNIAAEIGRYDVLVDNVPLHVGTIIKAKCTIGEFRGIKQLDLKRIHVLSSTADEIKEWADVARWKKDVLSKPWVLSEQRLSELRDRDEEERKRKKVQEKKEAERLRIKVRRWEEKAERRRRQEEVIMNAGAII